MKTIATSLACILAVAGAVTAGAQTKPVADAHAQHPEPAVAASQLDIPVDAQPAVAVVERFGKALATSDFETVKTLLDADVLILETGGAERSRKEYMGHHAIADALFLNGTHSQLKRRRARIDGDLVWVGSESELHASKDGKPMTLLSTETMVLKKTGGDWRIVHIHWSSRPKNKAHSGSVDTLPTTQPLVITADVTPSWLGADDRAVLVNAQGAGMAKAAEAHGWPGPKHALELADELQLDVNQRERMEMLMATMKKSARSTGAEVIAAEAALDTEFAKVSPNPDAIAALTEQVAVLRGRLRSVHLRTHLQAADLLTAKQRQRYVELRGGMHHTDT